MDPSSVLWWAQILTAIIFLVHALFDFYAAHGEAFRRNFRSLWAKARRNFSFFHTKLRLWFHVRAKSKSNPPQTM